jgi:hypothetical protein
MWRFHPRRSEAATPVPGGPSVRVPAKVACPHLSPASYGEGSSLSRHNQEKILHGLFPRLKCSYFIPETRNQNKKLETLLNALAGVVFSAMALVQVAVGYSAGGEKVSVEVSTTDR